MDIFFIHSLITWINALYDERTSSQPLDASSPAPAAVPTTWLSIFKKILYGIFAIIMTTIAFPANAHYIFGFIIGGVVLYSLYRLFLWIAPSWGPSILKCAMDAIILCGWVYMFMNIFAFTPKNYALILIPVMYLIFSVLYILTKQFMRTSDEFNMYTYGLAIASLLVAALVMRSPEYVMGASAFSAWLLRNSAQYMSYIPYIILISSILMIISSLIVLISYNLFITEYTKKTGTPPVLSGLYASYYDNYTTSMKSFATSGILMTLAYNTYITKSTDAAQDSSKHKPWISWLVTNVFAAITIAISSTELFNSAKFIDISRSSVI
jgi:hypothetical protein